jgi:hypothetical protein
VKLIAVLARTRGLAALMAAVEPTRSASVYAVQTQF